MLEKPKRQGASIFVYLIFCLLIAIFVINFGPQGGQGGGCSGGSNVILQVGKNEVSQSAYHVAYANQFNRGQGKQKTYVALETLIRRELLAQEAERRGMRVSSELVQEQIKKGYFFLGGQRTTIPGIFDENGFWNLKAFKNWYGSMNVSRASYVGEQGRSLLAAMMSQMLQDSVAVSRDEALQSYLFENNTVTYDIVAFRPDPYKTSMKLTDADVARFLTSHAKEVEDRYKADERTYKGMKPQLALRQIFIAKLEEPAAAPPVPAPAQGSGAGSAAGSGAGSAAPATPPAAPKVEDKKPEKKIGMSIDDAKKKLDDVRAAVAAGKQKFVDAAKQLNTDEAAKASGGELGWRTAENAMLGDKAVSDAIKTLKKGEMTPVITTDRGVYLLMAEDERSGDLSFDQVKNEIAKDLARDVWAKEAAKRAALAALDKARGQNLEQLYEKEKTPAGPGMDIEKILNDPNLTKEQKQQIMEMIMQQQQKSGAIVWESKDIPAAWRAQADGAGGSAAPAAGSAAPAPAAPKAAGSAAPTPTPAAPKAAGSAAPAPTPAAPKAAGSAAPAPTPAAPKAAGSAAPAAGSAAPAAGSATPAAPAAGSATPAAPAAGSAAPAAPTTTTAPATPPAAATPLVPTTDQLPAFDNVPAPFVTRFGPAPRSTPMSGLGSSTEAINAMFEELTPGQLAPRVYEADGAYIVVQLIARSSAKMDEFAKEGDRLVEELRAKRAQEFVEEWLKDRCEKLLADKKIKPNPQLVQEFDDAGKRLPVSYRPCMSFQQR
jgi:parvulin-like peptidyl-prolyl isomerase